ncbi:MAG TPA: hypothetical protein VJN18_13850 [Polyangiaceae bacterium]|nr:hypothetical protein [Polyangiaceae bacterium]
MQLKQLIVALSVLGLAIACKSEEPAQQGGYPPQQGQAAPYGQPPAQPGYGQPAPGTAPPPAPAPAPGAAPAAAPAAAPLSAPGPLALPCTSDANCATHHCNPQFGKCVFPCLNDGDCIAPNRCMAGACLPAAQ